MPIEFTELWIFVSADDDGDEGVVCWPFPNGMIMPLVAGDTERVEQLMPLAQKIAAERCRPVRLLHTAGLEFVDMIMPPGNQH